MSYIETDCTIEHEGRKFTSGGAVVTDDYLIAYPKEGGILADWHGNQIGTYSVISRRPAVFFGRPSWMGSTYCYMRGWVNNRAYSLRGFGCGMIARGRALKV